MSCVRAFISFDFDHDEDLKHALVGQSRFTDSPFEITDWSLKEAVPGNWRSEARARIRGADQVIVICGVSTHTARGVSVEVEIAREEGRPYFLLEGRGGQGCTRPTAAPNDAMYQWTWPNLRTLIRGGR